METARRSLREKRAHMNENKAALGYQDFEEVRTGQIFYIDKTDCKYGFAFRGKECLIG